MCNFATVVASWRLKSLVQRALRERRLVDKTPTRVGDNFVDYARARCLLFELIVRAKSRSSTKRIFARRRLVSGQPKVLHIAAVQRVFTRRDTPPLFNTTRAEGARSLVCCLCVRATTSTSSGDGGSGGVRTAHVVGLYEAQAERAAEAAAAAEKMRLSTRRRARVFLLGRRRYRPNSRAARRL